ncbi:MAG: phage head morphogenesis protein [Alphaproteobacteria bacterium]|nr:phage head morphogenesis protein [Alphaproteobacteria bacterium]
MADTPGAPPLPRTALEYFRAKGWNIPIDRAEEIWQEEHGNAFTVAKSAQADVLSDIRTYVDKAIEQGVPFERFAKELKPRLEQAGWRPDREKGRDIMPSRLRTIYDSNLRAAHAAGQFARAERTKRALPFFIYELGPSRVHREHHEELAGMIRPVDDPIWDTILPPNGYGCKCRVRQITAAEAQRRGYTGIGDLRDAGRNPLAPTTATNPVTGKQAKTFKGIDPAWSTNPAKGRTKYLANIMADKIKGYHPALARAVVADTVASQDFARYIDSPPSEKQVFKPIAVLSPDPSQQVVDKTGVAIDGNRVVRLSTETAQKMASKHPDITQEVWKQVQEAITKQPWQKAKKPNHYGIDFYRDDKHYRIVLKVLSNSEIYLLTLHRQNVPLGVP